MLLSLRTSGLTKADTIHISQDPSTDVPLLTSRLAAGDEAGFREFHARYFDRLYQFLLMIARGQEHEAREALQETLLRVVRYARKFETEDAFWSWLKVLARSAARDAGRKHHRYLNLLQTFASRWHGPTQAHAVTQDNQLGALLEECLDDLDPADRDLLAGKYLDGETVKELSARTGLTDKAVESRLVRLRRQLRERMLNKMRLP